MPRLASPPVEPYLNRYRVYVGLSVVPFRLVWWIRQSMIGQKPEREIGAGEERRGDQEKRDSAGEPPDGRAREQPVKKSLAVADDARLHGGRPRVRARRIDLLAQRRERAVRLETAASGRLEVQRFLIDLDLAVEANPGKRHERRIRTGHRGLRLDDQFGVAGHGRGESPFARRIIMRSIGVGRGIRRSQAQPDIQTAGRDAIWHLGKIPIGEIIKAIETVAPTARCQVQDQLPKPVAACREQDIELIVAATAAADGIRIGRG